MNTYSQIRKTQDLMEGLLVRHPGRAEKTVRFPVNSGQPHIIRT
jgi:hypothetical protein